MAKVKKLLLILLTLSLVFAFAACGGKNTPCDTCVDADDNGKCDNCKKDMPKTAEEVLLFDEDGEPLFQVVIAKDLPSSIRQAANTNIKMLLQREFEVDIDVVLEGSETDEVMETEILIGNVTSRGEKYSFDGHSLGLEGYTVRPLGTKLIIGGGSNNMIIEAISLFADEFLSVSYEYTELLFTEDDIIEYIQDGFDITSLKVNGTDMSGYTLAADLTRDYYREAATSMRDETYERTGYWFEIVDIENATDKSILMRHNSSLPDGESFKAHAVGSQLLIECAFDNKLFESVTEFSAMAIFDNEGDVNLTGTLYTKDISVVYYEDFYAKGDGVADDFKAIYDAHVFANECGQTVKADPDATYYIFETRHFVNGRDQILSIPIQTNTDWQGAKFIIDDTRVPAIGGYENSELSSYPIFTIRPNEEHAKVRIDDKETLEKLVSDGIMPGTTKIDFKLDGWDGDLMIVPYNEDHRVFRRRGYGGHSGAAMHELIVIDNEGNVSEETKIMFQYTNISYLDVFKLDPATAITVKNATIETRESKINQMVDGVYSTGYKARGIDIKRSYTTVENINHVVTGGFTLKERSNGFESAAAGGMFRAMDANHITIKDCIIPGRQSYGRHSSYNFNANLVNKIVLDHCIQSNFWVEVDYETGVMTGHTEYAEGYLTSMSSATVVSDSGEAKTHMMHWGIGGTNYCKNMEYIDSKISRFDAHAGLYDGKIVRTHINGMELTGVGDLLLDEITWYPYSYNTPFLFLRSDYGYTWDGDITVKNVDAYMFDITSNTAEFIFAHHNYNNWYYGYTCAFPNILVDNLDIFSLRTQQPVGPGYEIKLAKSDTSFKSKMHIRGDIGLSVTLDYADFDGDGFIDEPLIDFNGDGLITDADRVDLDGNGVIGNTDLPYNHPSYEGMGEDLWDGFAYSKCTVNVNLTKPPAYIKVINNDGADGKGGYVFRIPNTAGRGVSDGGWYRAEDGEETWGGFFGNTKFIYGEGENDFFHGTDHVDQNITNTFKFY